MKNNCPDFLIVGAAKSGTTTLHQLLKTHPDIYMPNRKELNFWYTYGRDDWAILERFPDLPRSVEEYASYFNTDKKIKGEASPGYLVCYNETIQNIKKLCPNYKELKIIMILREPIEKIWSHFKMVQRGNMDPDNYDLWNSLKEEKNRKDNRKYLLDVLPIFSTDYLPQVRAYKETFDNVLILLFEDLAKSPQGVMDSITEFLEVDPFTLPVNGDKKYNAAPSKTLPKNIIIESIMKLRLHRLFPRGLRDAVIRQLTKDKSMKKKTRKFLVNHYKNDIAQLQELTKLDLSSWLEKYH